MTTTTTTKRLGRPPTGVTRRQVSCTLDLDLIESLQQLSAARRISISTIVNDAVRHFLADPPEKTE